MSAFKQGSTKCFTHLVINSSFRYRLTKCSEPFTDHGTVIEGGISVAI